MNERLPYEEQLVEQIGSLPLPDENMAWADMKRRLEEDDDGIIVWWRHGCMLWGFLLLAVVGMGWWLLQPEKWFNSKSKSGQIAAVKQNDTIADKKEGKEATVIMKNTNGIQQNSNEIIAIEISNTDSAGSAEPAKVENVSSFQKRITTTKENVATIIAVSGKSPKKKNSKLIKDKQSDMVKISRKDGVPENENSQSDLINNEKPLAVKTVDKLSNVMQKLSVGKTDFLSSNTDKIDSTNKKVEKKDTTIAKKDSTKKKSVFFSAGIALQQQVPIAGQGFFPYNALGRKGTLTDYIPSIYIRLNKDKKWFLQSELKYGAPQLVKEFLYNRNTDSTNRLKPITTSLQLQKTYYHQVSFSFNYFIVTNLSFGGGIIWNRFSSAISSKDVVQQDRLTGLDSVISRGLIIRSKNADTAFAKSYFQAVTEVQYKLTRYSFGAKYSFGLQPYIKFTLPGGTTQEEKNSSLQLFIRYELWQSKQK
jgi:hypothetical protein